MTRDEAVDRALAWLRTPYHPGAMVMGVGVDCAMILVAVYAGHSAVPADIDPRPYPPDWHLHRSEEKYLGWMRQYADEIDRPMKADVVLCRFGRTYSHSAIVINDRGDTVHAHMRSRIVTRGNLSEFGDRPRLAFRVHGVEG